MLVALVEMKFIMLVEQMAVQEGVTERLKSEQQLLWVQRMNGIRERAEELVRQEIIFSL